ncbi:hypothetical protein CR513_50579, partial [Mucuna pruriens]
MITTIARGGSMAKMSTSARKRHEVNKEGSQDDIHGGQFPNILQCNTRSTDPKPVASNSIHNTSMHEVRVARRCYDESTRVSRGRQGRHITPNEQPQVHFLELDPRFDREDAR